MIDFIEPWAMKFILVTAVVAAVVAVTDTILLVRCKGTPRLEQLLPAVDSILVIAGFMASTGTCIVLIRSLQKINANQIAWEYTVQVMVSAIITAVIAWLLFFFFFEVWLFVRVLFRQYIKKLHVSS